MYGIPYNLRLTGLVLNFLPLVAPQNLSANKINEFDFVRSKYSSNPPLQSSLEIVRDTGGLIPYNAVHDKPLEQVIVVCDRYSGYKRLARENAVILLAFCWAHVRRDFLDAAKSWPDLEAWMLSWVERIGELYTLNAQRLEQWDEALALEDQAPAFMERHQVLEQAIEQMEERCDQELEKQRLHIAQRDALNSLKNHWLGLTVFVRFPQVPMDNNTAERRMHNPGMGRKNYYPRNLRFLGLWLR